MPGPAHARHGARTLHVVPQLQPRQGLAAPAPGRPRRPARALAVLLASARWLVDGRQRLRLRLRHELRLRPPHLRAPLVCCLEHPVGGAEVVQGGRHGERGHPWGHQARQGGGERALRLRAHQRARGLFEAPARVTLEVVRVRGSLGPPHVRLLQAAAFRAVPHNLVQLLVFEEVYGLQRRVQLPRRGAADRRRGGDQHRHVPGLGNANLVDTAHVLCRGRLPGDRHGARLGRGEQLPSGIPRHGVHGRLGGQGEGGRAPRVQHGLGCGRAPPDPR
mmetsp:Transcript_53056/g.151272  ORF Transcript_53056/g.151272 Transcript_53056/m.151272 type:complete len:276 (+) Transcript_53056:336-1163(+)